uniref:NADH-ubiquinone oxidoreductase chain 3 n=1 Tax=Rodolia quadrimaculata TaxID=2678939 RepID=A0A6B9MKU5_9CUCU|nr:NADH dehydrogenase subunit 3 [Rodolia quadrimaculata]
MIWLILSISWIIIAITNILMMIVNTISKKSFKDREKTSPFECGFDPKNSARLPFSLQFFLIAVIFIIFDIEITLIVPFISIKNINFLNLLILFIFFISILILGVFHEWKQGALSWKF